MKLVCPCCGAVASIEAWQNDPNARTALEVVLRLPPQLHSSVLPYLGLFRTGKSGLAWPRALKLLVELDNLIRPGTVRWDGGEERPAPPILWAQALDAVLARRPQGLGNHNYLRHVAWEMARSGAARVEQEKYAADQNRTPTLAQEEEPATPEDRAAVQKMLSEFTSKLGGRKK